MTSAADRAAARNARSGQPRSFTQLGVTVRDGRVFKGSITASKDLGPLKGACAGIDTSGGFLGGVTTFVRFADGSEHKPWGKGNRKPAEREIAEFNALADALDD